MKKKIITTVFFAFLCMIISTSLIAQQQVENPGFELWEEIGFGPDTLEPVDWSSLKSSDGGSVINEAIPVVWEQSTDAHSGMYSIKLINMEILTLVAPGTLTNGRVHAAVPPTDAYVYTIKEDPQWHTPFTDSPDSLRLWAKYFPQSGDIAHVIAILHKDTAKIADPDMFNWIAAANLDFPTEVNEWTEFSVPFVYLSNETPEYILFAIYAGDAQASQLGSILYLDDIEMVYHTTGHPEIIQQKPEVYFAGDELVIKSSDANITPLRIELYDLTGKMIFNERLMNAGHFRLNTNLPAGLYQCRILGPKQNHSFKLIKH
ncbi:MAG: T9SS type A sorting domain-containing protein [Bacteroidetes bacterium]|nr:T9SS type A sorting domain-containing protein [Bacteroidota bacterium]